ncbi:MAG TPA: hypothetical protein VLF69_02660 [Candidatus Saccharimonadales bacterium]|nr:hypothetical protein [Candidatus Saccharimonadales bacterium]
MSKIPALIAARNAPRVGETVSALADTAWPIVIPNGCTDDTAEIAERAGATIVDCDVEGKTPALQAGIQFLGEAALHEPFMMVDADTVPVFRSRFVDAMGAARSRLDPDKPALLVGPLRYIRGASFTSDLARTVILARRQFRSQFDPNAGRFGGNSMLLDINGNEALLDAILGLGNLWPCEDEAIKDAVVSHGGNTLKVMDVRALATTDCRSAVGFFERLKIGAAAASAAWERSYADDAPEGSVPYVLRRGLA